MQACVGLLHKLYHGLSLLSLFRIPLSFLCPFRLRFLFVNLPMFKVQNVYSWPTWIAFLKSVTLYLGAFKKRVGVYLSHLLLNDP